MMSPMVSMRASWTGGHSTSVPARRGDRTAFPRARAGKKSTPAGPAREGCAKRGSVGGRGANEALVQRAEQVGVAVLRVPGELALEVGQALEEAAQRRGVERLHAQAVALALEVARVQQLFELLLER